VLCHSVLEVVDDPAEALTAVARVLRPGGLASILVANRVAAATDVTGFGLLGHGLEMARASRGRFVFESERLPALPGALELAAAGIETGGAAHNRRFVRDELEVGATVSDELVTLAHDPQTSGGLLAAIPGDGVDGVVERLDQAGIRSWRVGRVEEGAGVSLR